MKVSEAKEKVCPFMQVQKQDADGISYIGNCKCICGDCMAWKFTKTTSFKMIPYDQYDHNEAEEITVDGLWYYLHEDADYYISEDFDLQENAEGYCARIGNV